MVYIGSARIDEHGKITGGQIGNQNGKECSIQNWYLSNKGWYVIRPIKQEDAEDIARNMIAICKGNVGYDQSNRTNLYELTKPFKFDVSKLGNTPAECDCSEAVRVCCAYAGIVVSPFTTASEVNTLKRTNRFDILTDDIYCKKPDYLKRGDILVTRSKGHTVVVTSNGDKASIFKHPLLTRGDYGASVGYLQSKLKNLGCYSGRIDNDFGIITFNSVLMFQSLCGITKDGKVGSMTWDLLEQK